MNEVAPYIAGLSALLAAAVTGYFAWSSTRTEINSPDKLADGFSNLVANLRTELERYGDRIKVLEERRIEDVKHIAALEVQLDWVLDKLDNDLKREFYQTFRPFTKGRNEEDLG